MLADFDSVNRYILQGSKLYDIKESLQRKLRVGVTCLWFIAKAIKKTSDIHKGFAKNEQNFQAP